MNAIDTEFCRIPSEEHTLAIFKKLISCCFCVLHVASLGKPWAGPSRVGAWSDTNFCQSMLFFRCVYLLVCSPPHHRCCFHLISSAASASFDLIGQEGSWVQNFSVLSILPTHLEEVAGEEKKLGQWPGEWLGRWHAGMGCRRPLTSLLSPPT